MFLFVSDLHISRYVALKALQRLPAFPKRACEIDMQNLGTRSPGMRRIERLIFSIHVNLLSLY